MLTELAPITQILSSVATVILVLVAVLQIREMRKQSEQGLLDEKKWRTTQACEKFDSDPIVTQATRNIRNRLHKKEHATLDVYNDCAVVFNYFESIAIGIDQKLYNEDIVRDHFEDVIQTLHRDLLVGAGKPTNLGPDEFPSLARLITSWTSRETRFQSS